MYLNFIKKKIDTSVKMFVLSNTAHYMYHVCTLDFLMSKRGVTKIHVVDIRFVNIWFM